MADSDAEAGDVEAIGITNQRETTVVWDRESGEPVYNAIVWQDTRTVELVREFAGDEGRGPAARGGRACRCRPTSPGPKIALDPRQRRRRARAGGRTASWRSGRWTRWVLWNLTGGTKGGVHVTDVTNASRTMLMDLETLEWHERALDLMGIPESMLPGDPLVAASSTARRPARAIGGRPIAGILGDQHAALFGQTCFEPRRREEHLRHRLVPARQHGRGDRALGQAADERRLQARRREPASTCSRARSPSPAR